MNILKSYLDIWLIPTANPEGLNVVHEGLDLSFRKNKKETFQAMVLFQMEFLTTIHQ